MKANIASLNGRQKAYLRHLLSEWHKLSTYCWLFSHPDIFQLTGKCSACHEMSRNRAEQKADDGVCGLSVYGAPSLQNGVSLCRRLVAKSFSRELRKITHRDEYILFIYLLVYRLISMCIV